MCCSTCKRCLSANPDTSTFSFFCSTCRTRFKTWLSETQASPFYRPVASKSLSGRNPDASPSRTRRGFAILLSFGATLTAMAPSTSAACVMLRRRALLPLNKRSAPPFLFGEAFEKPKLGGQKNPRVSHSAIARLLRHLLWTLKERYREIIYSTTMSASKIIQ